MLIVLPTSLPLFLLLSLSGFVTTSPVDTDGGLNADGSALDDPTPQLSFGRPQHEASEALSSPSRIEGLLNLSKRQGYCQSGYGICSVGYRRCCRLGGDCCPDGRCCYPGDWCYYSGGSSHGMLLPFSLLTSFLFVLALRGIGLASLL
jgi:hypothetical protein